MTKISAVIITFNEEQRIVNTLESVKWCDEIIVVDSCSTDKTVEICKQYSNCKVFIQPFLGYGSQKKYAIDLASNNWVINIDADEVLTNELSKEIQNILAKDEIVFTGFHVPITHVFLGKIFKFGREYKHYHLRMFNKNFGNFNADKVHERLVVDGIKAKLNEQLLHYSYASIHHYFEKFNEYTTIAAQHMLKRNKKASKFGVFLKFPFSFFKYYFLDLNFMNGYAGFVWSLFSAYYKVVRVVKYLEMKGNN